MTVDGLLNIFFIGFTSGVIVSAVPFIIGKAVMIPLELIRRG